MRGRGRPGCPSAVFRCPVRIRGEGLGGTSLLGSSLVAVAVAVAVAGVLGGSRRPSFGTMRWSNYYCRRTNVTSHLHI